MSSDEVSIFDGICDRPDRCGREDCEYFDDSGEATRRYMRASGRSRTMEGMREDRLYEEGLRQRHGQQAARR